MEATNTCPTEVADQTVKADPVTKAKTAEQTVRRTPEELAAERGIDLAHELTKGPVARYIRGKAREISRHGGFTRSDIDDVRQILSQRICQNVGQYDPEVASFLTFVITMVERYTINIIRHQQAGKRGRRVTCFLSAVIEEDGEPTELVNTIGEREQSNRLFLESPNPRTALDASIDLEDAIATLPRDLRRIARLLKVYTPSQLARHLGVPRSTLQYPIAKIRLHLQETGVRDYL